MADKYDIIDLTRLARNKLQVQLSGCVTEDLLSFTEDVCMENLPSQNQIRSAIVTECLKRMDELVKNDIFMNLLSEHGSFGAMLVQEMHFETSRDMSNLSTEAQDGRNGHIPPPGFRAWALQPQGVGVRRR